MILTCPNCATRYEADAAKFLPAGRKVRCAKCGHTWHQPAPATEAGSPTPEPAAAITADVAKAPEAEKAPEPVSPVRLGPPPVQGPQWRMGPLAGWVALIALVAILGWGAIVFRQAVATFWPQTATVYSWIGLDVNTVGLAFKNVSYRVTSENDMPVLYIKGAIVNVTERTLDIPNIQAALTDENRRELYDWKIRAPARNIASGKSVEFSARVASPPTSARHVDLKFVKS